MRNACHIFCQIFPNTNTVILKRKYMRIKRSLLMLLRKHLIFIVIIVLVLIYLLTYSNLFSSPTFVIKTKRLDDCVKSLVSTSQTKVENIDATLISHPLEPGEYSYLPYTGNGYFGTSWNGQNRLYIAKKHSLGIAIPFSPVISLNLPGYTALEKTVIDFTDGNLLHLSCFKQMSMCVSSELRAYAHRVVPFLFVQELSVSNPTNNQLNLQLFKENKVTSWTGVVQRNIRLKVDKNKYEYKQSTGLVKEGSVQFIVSILEPNFPPFVSVKPNGAIKHQFLTFIRYTLLKNEKPAKMDDVKMFESVVHVEAVKVFEVVSVDSVFSSHKSAWSGLWQQGFSITQSLAPEALNGDRINSTLYYMLTQRLFFPNPVLNQEVNNLFSLVQERVNDTSINKPAALLSAAGVHAYEQCFRGHDLFQAVSLWQSPADEEALSQLAQLWMITLEKNGCSTLIRSGAQGFLQAALLAIGEFSFSGNHLEFNLHSSQLVRDMTFRNIAYGPFSSVNITVEVDDSNKALLFVAVKSSKKFYACDAGCKDPPVVLADLQRTQLPLKITKPRTPLLYVTPNREHIEELKHAIHVQEIVDAPAHEHHVIALHKHGHPYGGLPLLFWVAIISLIVVFHLFLFKLVYTEYCKGEPLIPPYSKY